MFYAAQALLLGEGVTFAKHSAVIAAFGQHFAKTGRVPPEVHRHLIEAQVGRITGDYDASPTLSKADAAKQIERAERFLEVAGQLLGPVPPPT